MQQKDTFKIAENQKIRVCIFTWKLSSVFLVGIALRTSQRKQLGYWTGGIGWLTSRAPVFEIGKMSIVTFRDPLRVTHRTAKGNDQ